MRPLGSSESLPQWTKFVVTDLGGRDPLGLARVATHITDFAMPGIVVTTDRARYFALYTWMLWNVRLTEDPKSLLSWQDGFQRREAAVAVATLLQDQTSAPVGKRAVNKELRKQNSDVLTAFRVLPSNNLGGYGQYYGGSMGKLGLVIDQADTIGEIRMPRGERLALAVESTVASTPWVKGGWFKRKRVPRDVLMKSAERLGIDAIRETFAKHERDALIEIFFGLDSEERGGPSNRRASLARMLDLVQTYSRKAIPLGGTDRVLLEEQMLFGPAYFGSLVNAKGAAAAPYTPPSSLATITAYWRQYCLHEFLSLALESLLHAVLIVLEESKTGLSVERVAQELSSPQFNTALRSTTGIRATSPRDLMKELGVEHPPAKDACAAFRQKFSAKSSLNELSLSRIEPRDATSWTARGMALLGLLYSKWRDGSDDEAWSVIAPGRELATKTVLQVLDAWLSPDATWQGEIHRLVLLLIKNHDRVMYEKGRLEACWLGREEDRVVYEQDYSPAFPAHASRHRAALGVLEDLGLVRRDDKDAFHPTAAGGRLLTMVEGMER